MSNQDEWMTRLIEDPAYRRRELVNASRIELLFSVLAFLFAVATIWGFTSGETVAGWLSAASVGGLSVLCFSACMATSAGGGIRRRFIALIRALELRERA